MTKTEAAYLAGIVDGEGCVHFARSGVCNIHMHLIVVQRDPAIIQWLHAVCGGKIVQFSRQSWGKERTYWRWSINSKSAGLPILREILPYLVLKRDKVKIAIQLMESVIDGGKRWTTASHAPLTGNPGRPRSLTPAQIEWRTHLFSQLNQTTRSDSTPDLAEDGPK